MRPLTVEKLERRRLLAGLSGFAFIDTNGDGLRASGESGIPGIRIDLRNEAGETLQTAFTSDLGFYSFVRLEAGTYSVATQQPEAFIDGPESSPHPNAAIGEDIIENIELDDFEFATENNFGEAGMKAQHISPLWVLSSSGRSEQGAVLRGVVAAAEQAAGNILLANLIRENTGSSDPIATPDRYQVVAGQELLVPPAMGVLHNDVSPSGAELTPELNQPPTNGTVSLNADGSFSYTSNVDFVGVDSFTYRVTDAIGDEASEVVTVAIEVASPPNRIPVTIGDEFQTNEDETLSVPSPGILENDSDADGDTLDAVVVQLPDHGTLTLNEDGSFEYQPDPNFFGTDSFNYIARDDETESKETSVQLIVSAVNDAPFATADAYLTSEDEALTIDAVVGLLANDQDIENDALEASLLENASNGTVTLNADGSFAYQPSPGFSGFDSFTYVATDGVDSSAETTVTIDVGSVNDAPIATADQFATDEDTRLVAENFNVLDNDVDPDGDALTAELVQQPENGNVTLNSDGTFEYTPNDNFNGVDSFTYVASDGLRTSEPTTVSITIAAVNDEPLAVDDQYGINQDETLTVIVDDGVLANDSDTDNDVLTVKVLDSPGNGQVSVNADGSFEYVPADGFAGVDSFTYEASDGRSVSIATVTIAVTSTNIAPQANDDAYEVVENEVLTVDVANGVLTNDSDADRDPLTAVVFAQPTNGTLVFNDAGSFSYTPFVNFTGADSFSYLANDGIATSSEATVSINVTPAPIILNETVTLGASKDNSLFESTTGSLSNGVGEYLFVGKTLQTENFLRRGLIAFDFSSIPAGATITDVSLTLNMSRTIVGAFDVTLHRVTQDWGEGSSDAAAEEGLGIDSATNDATWIHAFFDSQTWSTPGGDFDPAVSGSASVDGVGFYTWSSAEMVTDVQNWLDDPSTNAGWLLLTDENDITAKRFDSRENSTVANQPRLVVEYEFESVAQAAATARNFAVESIPAHDPTFTDATSNLPGDANDDGEVSFHDFIVLAANFGSTDAAFADGDFTGDRSIDFSDFLVLAKNFGKQAVS